MSTPTPDPSPAPVFVNSPPASIDWTKIFAFIVTAIAALLAGPHVIPPVNPPPVVVTPPVVVPPVVTPPVVNPPVVAPPVILPPVVNPPVVTPPNTNPPVITVTDTKGNPIQGSVTPGQQVVITAPDGTTLTPVSDNTQIGRADVTQLGNKLVVTLTDGYRLLIVVTTTGQPPTLLTVQANHAAQPPPVVVTPPVVTPPVNPPVVVTPPPVPAGTKRFTVTVVEDPKVIRTVTTASILNNLTNRKTLTDKGHVFNATTNTSSDAAAAYVRNNPCVLPALAIFDNSTQTFVKAIPLPTDLGMSMLASLGG